MEKERLKFLIENQLYPIVLAYAQDELKNVDSDTLRNAKKQFVQMYKKELTIENIDFLTEYIDDFIKKAKKRNNIKEDKSNIEER